MAENLKQEGSYKIAIIGDQLLVTGFKLAGVKNAQVVENGDEAEKALWKVFDTTDTGIIIILENLMSKIKDRRLLYKINNSLIPLVIQVPAYNEEEKNQDTLRALVMRVIGIDILSKSK